MKRTSRLAAFIFHPISAVAAAVAGLTCAALVAFPQTSVTQPAPPAADAQVHGFIAVRVGGKSELGQLSFVPEDVFLPNVRVVLRDRSSGFVSDPVVTDLSGRFTALVPTKTRLAVCWEAKGFKAGCGEPFSMSQRFQNIRTTYIPLPRTPRAAALYGSVTMADGSLARTLQPFSNINSFPTVSLLDRAGAAVYRTPVNNHGMYLIPNAAVQTELALRVQQEGYDRAQPLVIGNDTVPTQRIDLTIANSPPKIEPVVALDASNQRVAAARSGDTVVLDSRVSDRDGDSLKFLWEVDSGSLSSATDPRPQWRLDGRTGSRTASLIVYDDRGGYARSNVQVRVDPSGIIFSGFVSATDAPAVGGAEVDVNGRQALTDASGWFQIKVPDRKRFVLNIRKHGYGFVSNIYYDGVSGGRWQLTRAQTFNVDPTQPISVSQRDRRPSECAGPPSERLNWRGSAPLLTPAVQDGRGNTVTSLKELERLPGLPTLERPQRQNCGPGASIEIPANALVDANGAAPGGRVDVHVMTVDLDTPNQMPGNYTVILPNGQPRVMQPYGAAIVDISAGGNRFNLRPGESAKLTIPIDRTQLEAGGPLPPTIPLVGYDEVRGVWRDEGVMTLQSGGGIPVYEAVVKHLSAYNSDLIKVNQSCLAVQNNNMPATYNLEVTIPQTGGAAPAKRLFNAVGGGSSETVLLNLPSQTNIVLVPIRTSGANASLPMGVFVVNTGAPQNPAWPTVPGGFVNEPVGPPYYHETNGTPDGACSTKVVLQDLGLKFFPDPNAGAFLHGLYSFAAVNLTETDPAFPGDANQTLRDAVELASADYRAQIDPRGLRPTLSCYKVVNRMPLRTGESCPQHAGTGFTAQPALAETTAAYANTVDLGFGREMHCVRDGAKVACYVSNYDSQAYTSPVVSGASDVDKAQAAVQGLLGNLQPDATVAMEYTPIEDHTPNGTPITFTEDPNPVVKFYVFNAAGGPVDKANLDGFGARPVPQLCMVCHGGFIPKPSGATSTTGGIATPVFGSRLDVNLNSKFLPFDLQSLSFSPTAPHRRGDQENAFKTLNDMVKVAPPPNPAEPTSTVIEALNTAWYPGGAAPQLDNVAPSLWDSLGDAQRTLHKGVYVDVVSRSCRTCHVTNPDETLRFDRPANFDALLGTVQLRVCKQHVMPHSRRTHDLLWTSLNPSQPAQLQVYGDTMNTGGWQKLTGAPGEDLSLACGQSFTAGGGPPIPPTSFSPVATIFSGQCVGCHNTSNAVPGSGFNVAGLDLSGGTAAYPRIVDVPATEHPSTSRVIGGTNTQIGSYLWHKVDGSAGTLAAPFFAPGNSPNGGAQMPLGGSLSNTDKAIITNWIQGGALP